MEGDCCRAVQSGAVWCSLVQSGATLGAVCYTGCSVLHWVLWYTLGAVLCSLVQYTTLGAGQSARASIDVGKMSRDHSMLLS